LHIHPSLKFYEKYNFQFDNWVVLSRMQSCSGFYSPIGDNYSRFFKIQILALSLHMAIKSKFYGEGLTFDDVLLVPAYSEVLPREVSLTTQLTKDIKLNIPMVSAAMDTVTEATLAIALAREGGIGMLHKNMSIERQAEQVRKVKRSESGLIVDPITLSPDATE
jgi:hypothetical protein